MWVYFFSGEKCKYCPEPKLALEEFAEENPKIAIAFKDNTDPLFKQFGLSKIPSMVIVESCGDIKKYEGRGYVHDEIERLSIITKLNLTVEF